MAKLQQLPARRKPSPLIGDLREKLARANKRARNVKDELQKSYSAPVVIGIQVTTAGGGAAAGAVQGFLGDGMMGRGVAVGVGAVLVGVGAFLVPGAFGAAVAATGGGMFAKVLGDVVENAIVGSQGGAA